MNKLWRKWFVRDAELRYRKQTAAAAELQERAAEDGTAAKRKSGVWYRGTPLPSSLPTPSSPRPLPAAPVKTPTAAQSAILLQELREAHISWVCAYQRFNYALEQDEVEYAVFALEAAEKRYDMLLKQAKKAQLKANRFGARPPAPYLEAK